MGRGRAVWQHLTALVGIPLLAATVLAGSLTGRGVGDLQDARSAQEQLRTSEQVDAVRRAVDAELLPTLVLRIAQDRVLARRAGLEQPDGRDTGRATLLSRAPSDLERARAATDRAIAGVGQQEAAVAVGVAADQLFALRADTDRGLHGLGALADDFRYVSDVLVVAEREASVEAAATGLSRRSAPAVADVERLVGLSTSATRQLPAALVATVLTGEDRDAALRRWRAASGDLEHLDDPEQEPLVAALATGTHDALHSPAAQALAGGLSSGWALDPTSPGHLGGVELLALRPLSADRDADLAVLVGRAHGLAEAATAADAEAAASSLRLTGVLCLLALLGGTWATVAAARSLAAALRRLGRDARELQEGALLDRPASGPRELRDVARALRTASRGLHRVREQVEAVARGDLGRAVELPAVPGPLGGAVHASVTSLVAAVRARDALRAELAHRADHDPLTGLRDRAAAEAALEAQVERSRRTGEQVAVFFVDLDGFKAVNDGCGHAAGDVLLRAVAGRLRDGVREEDLVGRLGGDEFVVVMADISVEDALAVAERLVELVARPVRVPVGGDERERTVGASIGVALQRAGSVAAPALLTRADTAAYRAKAAGRGRVVLFDEALRAEVAREEERARDLPRALAAGEVLAEWEPQVLAQGRVVTGHRARPVWHRPAERGGAVGTAELVRCAEATGLGRAVGRALLAQAAEVLREAPRGGACVVVALTDRHAADPAVLDDVTEVLEATGRPGAARDLYVEVGERALADPDVVAHLHVLRALGVPVGVVVDGLTPLRDLPGAPVDVVVLSQDLVRDDPRQQRVARLVAGASAAAGVLVSAEGVVTEEQAARLVGLGTLCLSGPLVALTRPGALLLS
ncbi:sensor domain-containing diguanylate cyclase [Quadrisphaera sp. INWT6]|uniref:sensor domain-containing diguanylate cyclase n=1 Tax=Quadrisphaera sp. INWT6 TaxID=2596917 RepID=UPI0018923946|nr:sensor domain-containing diguanylate cyclase [Quadrisphaera sp. INWT6]MBF5082806.1 diguanylate cyclase [Quadrisphaera sp. INWT6]